MSFRRRGRRDEERAAGFAFGVAGIAAAAAMVAPAPDAPPAEKPDASPITTKEARPVRIAPQPGGMISHSYPAHPVTVYGPPLPQPPIVAIPRIPGPADMMVATGRDGEVRTIQSFAPNEACDEALPTVRRTISNAFCVSTTMPPPEPEHGYLVEVHTESNEWIGLETYPSMAECQRVLAARGPKPGIQSACTPKLH